MTRRTLLLSAVAAIPNSVRWVALDIAKRSDSHDWPDRETPICVGSLLKPFLALAYGATHVSYPEIGCAGTRTGCWYAPGHGRQDIVRALTNSCNTYFLNLSAALDRAALEATSIRYGLKSPDRNLTPAALLGLAGGWPQAPVAILHAFARISGEAKDPSARLVLEGMAKCAARGTARDVKLACYAKTGTAPCSHVPKSAGDGYVVAIYPIDRPRCVLLVQHHNVTGATAARDVKPLLEALW